MKEIVKALILMSLCSCAKLHHVQVGDIDATQGGTMTPFELKVSETGVNFEEAGRVLDALGGSKGRAGIGEKASGYLGMIQMGPHTGEPVFSDKYAANLARDIYKECPSGRITGVMSIRETRKYPVISGEIVKVTGYCLAGKRSDADGNRKIKAKSAARAQNR